MIQGLADFYCALMFGVDQYIYHGVESATY